MEPIPPAGDGTAVPSQPGTPVVGVPAPAPAPTYPAGDQPLAAQPPFIIQLPAQTVHPVQPPVQPPVPHGTDGQPVKGETSPWVLAIKLGFIAIVMILAVVLLINGFEELAILAILAGGAYIGAQVTGQVR